MAARWKIVRTDRELEMTRVDERLRALGADVVLLPDGGTLPATDKVVELTMGAFFLVGSDGLIQESHRYQDNLGFLRALGVIG